jgi:hypothetical protein
MENSGRATQAERRADSPQKTQKDKRHKAGKQRSCLCFLSFCVFCGESPHRDMREAVLIKNVLTYFHRVITVSLDTFPINRLKFSHG